MTPAPTNEIAIGIKMMDLKKDSKRTFSMTKAITKPRQTVIVVKTTNQSKLFLKIMRLFFSVRIFKKLSMPTKLVPYLSIRLKNMVWRAGYMR